MTDILWENKYEKAQKKEEGKMGNGVVERDSGNFEGEKIQEFLIFLQFQKKTRQLKRGIHQFAVKDKI